MGLAWLNITDYSPRSLVVCKRSHIGWLSLWILFKHLQYIPTYKITSSLKLADFVLILTAFLGITGHLPKTVMGFILGIGKFADRLLSGK